MIGRLDGVAACPEITGRFPGQESAASPVAAGQFPAPCQGSGRGE